MTDKEFASIIFGMVFNTLSDEGDVNTQGILDAICALEEREQTALKSYYRDGNSYRQTAEILGNISNETARRIVQKAILKLRHPCKSRTMSFKAISSRKKLLESASEEF